MSLTLQQIEHLYLHQGQAQYDGEAVSQLDHALQAAWLAEQAGDDDALVIACLLHDLGHLLAESAPPVNRDDWHQYKALSCLRAVLPAAVVEPIGLHVEAKRYLCRIDPHYLPALSPASHRSLVLQGGEMTALEARAFMRHPHSAHAVALRRHDDAAKVAGLKVPPFMHYLPRLHSLAQRAIL